MNHACRIRRLAPLFIVTLSLLAFSAGILPILAAQDTYTVVNPATGNTEAVWTATPTGSSTKEVYFSILQDTGWIPSQRITTNDVSESAPRLTFTPQGDRRVVWGVESSRDDVFLSEQPLAGGAWSQPELASDGVTDAVAPRAATFAGSTFIVWQGVPKTGNGQIIVGKRDDPNPIGRTLIAISSWQSPLSLEIHQESGHLWVTWADSALNMAWSEYTGGAWTSAALEPYSGSSDIESARVRIRNRVLGL